MSTRQVSTNGNRLTVTSSNKRGSTSTTYERAGNTTFVVGRSHTTRGFSFSESLSILRIVALFVLFLCLFSALFGSARSFSLRSLLSAFESVPATSLSSLRIPAGWELISGDWGIFNFFREFVNSLASVISNIAVFVSFLVTGLIQILSLLWKFLSLL